MARKNQDKKTDDQDKVQLGMHGGDDDDDGIFPCFVVSLAK